jgi:hypothetical protein
MLGSHNGGEMLGSHSGWETLGSHSDVAEDSIVPIYQPNGLWIQ